MKLLLIIPHDLLYNNATGYTKLISYEPLTLSVLAALVPAELNIEITTVDEGMETFDYDSVFFDVVGISTVTSASIRAYELCDHFKKKGSYVVLGGHHVTLMPNEGITHADTVFIGRSEKTWPEFFYDYMNGNPRKFYEQEPSSDVHIPVPRRDLIRRNKYLKQPIIIANSGCSNSCNFCSISAFWKGCGAKRPIPDVIREIKSLKTKQFIFLDPNQYADKEYVKELYMELRKLKVQWAGLSTHNISEDDEMLEAMTKAGCRGLFIGFETLNQTNLSEAGKTPNNVIKYKEAIKKIHSYNLAITGSFMLGFDSDTKESLLDLPEQIEELDLDIMRYGIVTPIPNTALYRRLDGEGRILTTDWSKYDSCHSVYQPKNMEPHELEEIFIKVWKKSYTYKKILSRLGYTKGLTLLKFFGGVGFRIYIKQLERLRSIETGNSL